MGGQRQSDEADGVRELKYKATAVVSEKWRVHIISLHGDTILRQWSILNAKGEKSRNYDVSHDSPISSNTSLDCYHEGTCIRQIRSVSSRGGMPS